MKHLINHSAVACRQAIKNQYNMNETQTIRHCRYIISDV